MAKKKQIKKFKKIMLFDFSQIAHAAYHQSVKSDKQLKNIIEKGQYWKYIMLNMILKSKLKFVPDEIILCVDSRSWRNDVFKYYKAKRRLARKERAKDAEMIFFYETLEEFIEELRKSFPFRVIRVEGAEADDIIAILAQKYQPHQVIIISGDHDFQQLLDKNIILYSPIQKKEIKQNDPQRYRLIHIITGDSGDGVPNILSDDDTFINENKRQKACGAKKLEQIFNKGLEEWLGENPEASANFDRNKELVDLTISNLPKEIVTNVVKEYKISKPTANYVDILRYLRLNNMRSLTGRINDFL